MNEISDLVRIWNGMECAYVCARLLHAVCIYIAKYLYRYIMIYIYILYIHMICIYWFYVWQFLG